MKRKTMLLFGGSGLLGSNIIGLLSKQYTIIAPSRTNVDLVIRKQVEGIVERTKADVIVYAAGETNVDKAEKDKEYAMKINNDAISWIAKRAILRNTQVVYFSTDAVFKGDQSERAYRETDYISPLNYYGLTKAKGEEAVLTASKKNLVIRLITLYSCVFPRKLDFARIILKSLANKKPCFGIVDQYCNPTFSDTAVGGLLESIKLGIAGILHFGATDYITNYDFVAELAGRFGYEQKRILPITLSEFFKDKKANRAKYTWLDTTKAQKLLGNHILHTNRDNLDQFTNTLRKLNST